MDRHRQQCHQATSERQIVVAPLSLIAVQSQNLMVAHPVLIFPSAVGRNFRMVVAFGSSYEISIAATSPASGSI
jgi:hypothetical protein